MILNLLAVGDVVSDDGLNYLSKHLRQVKRLHDVHFTVVNGENASGVGILPRQARDIFDAGADVINSIRTSQIPASQDAGIFLCRGEVIPPAPATPPGR